jgi:nucleotide-binding universal stress UspA family protein
VDLIVMGTHGRSGLSRLFLGSVAARVSALASCPVVTIRAGARARPRTATRVAHRRAA